MSAGRSFRSHFVLGATLWTLGLLGVAHVTFFLLATRAPIVLRLAHSTLITLLAIGLLIAGLLQVRRGMSPFSRLRERLAAVRVGREHRVEGSYPTEVQTLVDDLNALLDHREEMVRRALAKAGDLAHGLKTPLAVLTQEAEQAEAAGHHHLAAIMSQQVSRMQRQMDYHLALARAAASGAAIGVRCSVATSAEGLSRTLLRLHAGRGITINGKVPPGLAVACRSEDLDEMLGNLLDNACKWARSRVLIGASSDGANVVITVDDDGPGLDPSLLNAVLQRGVRADEAAPGSGFGLAIVRDLAELYGGSISLESSPAGGLRARLRLPAAS